MSALEPVQRRNPARMPGETNAVCIARLSGEIRALQVDMASRDAAIKRVRTQATETLRLCREAGVPESSAHLSPQAVLRALDGPRASE